MAVASGVWFFHEGNRSEAKATNGSEMLAQYDDIRLALADDSLDGAKSAARALESAATGEVAALARDIANASDATSARAAFETLSTTLAQSRSESIAVAYCSMAKKSWLQSKAEPIANPYLGRSMRPCGEFKTN